MDKNRDLKKQKITPIIKSDNKKIGARKKIILKPVVVTKRNEEKSETTKGEVILPPFPRRKK